jgi:indole-3-glycerol phosphate synthase/phosphoribosylanthranilate isomerase
VPLHIALARIHLIPWKNALIDAIPNILARIIATKKEALASSRFPLEQWEFEAGARRRQRRDFQAALQGRVPAIIAEVKKASPSKGVLAADFDPVRTATAYERGGAAALSVLTDEQFFQGSLRDLEMARAATALPILRKDFTIAPQHVLEAAAHGADAILLIAAILSEGEIRDFREAAERFGMAALVEVHNRPELDRALGGGARVIGVNNRDLTTFEVSLETSLRLAEFIPGGIIRVSESGIRDAADIATLRSAGYSAFLIGERLMTANDPDAALRELVTGRNSMGTILKICGITNAEDAAAAVEGGATAIGFNFYAGSPRHIAPERAQTIPSAPGVRRVGVFVNETRHRIEEIARTARLDVAQLHGDELAADYPAGLEVWKAVRVTEECDLSALEQCPAQAVVLDGPAAERYGGAGKPFDWRRAAALRKPVVLAGGLDASNVKEAIALARPWGVDACSRVESAPGKKDHHKMKAFLAAAKAALQA